MTETMTKNLGISRSQARARAIELLDQVQIQDPESRLQAFPDQLSGGMRQRVMIALAMSCGPRLLLADEPTTALDVTVQAQIIRLILDLQQQAQSAMIFVTHDIGVAANVADDVAVMYGGRVVEQGPIADVLSNPQHPYTRGLIDANVTPGQRGRLRTISGQPPAPHRLPPGCSFSDRCPHVRDECRAAVPPLYPLPEPGRSARCVLVADQTRAVAMSNGRRSA
jgi:oligopeptide/dipeptide ABC transporter ATP-binding protein